MARNLQRILLVEDEALVRYIAQEALEEAGYEVLAAESADEALDILRSRADVGLLFTDVNMPGSLDGMQLAELVHRTWPDVKLVVTSGRGAPGNVPDDGAFLHKPYSLAELSHAIVTAGGAAPRRWGGR